MVLRAKDIEVGDRLKIVCIDDPKVSYYVAVLRMTPAYFVTERLRFNRETLVSNRSEDNSVYEIVAVERDIQVVRDDAPAEEHYVVQSDSTHSSVSLVTTNKAEAEAYRDRMEKKGCFLNVRTVEEALDESYEAGRRHERPEFEE